MKQIAAYFLPHVLVVALFLAFCVWAHLFAPVIPDEEDVLYFPASPSFELRRRAADIRGREFLSGPKQWPPKFSP